MSNERPDRRYPFLAGWLVSIALCTIGCHRDRPIRAVTEAGNAWVQVGGQPDASGAIGYMQSDELAEAYPLVVAEAASGRKEKLDANDLLQAPFTPSVGEGGEYPAPAVFAREGSLVLLSSKGGWVWSPIPKSYQYISYEKCLDDLVAQDAREDMHPMQEGWSLQSGWLFNLPSQALRERPSDYSPVMPEAIPDHFSYTEASWPGLKSGQIPWDPPVLGVEQLNLAETSREAGSLVRVLQRKGDWLQVVLPRKDRQLYFILEEGDPLGIMVSWAPTSSGWVRWRRPGARKGTTELRFSATYWGFAD